MTLEIGIFIVWIAAVSFIGGVWYGKSRTSKHWEQRWRTEGPYSRNFNRDLGVGFPPRPTGPGVRSAPPAPMPPNREISDY